MNNLRRSRPLAIAMVVIAASGFTIAISAQFLAFYCGQTVECLPETLPPIRLLTSIGFVSGLGLGGAYFLMTASSADPVVRSEPGKEPDRSFSPPREKEPTETNSKDGVRFVLAAQRAESDGIVTRSSILLGFVSLLITGSLALLSGHVELSIPWVVWAVLLLLLSGLAFVFIVVGRSPAYEHDGGVTSPDILSQNRAILADQVLWFQAGTAFWLLGTFMLFFSWIGR